MRKFALVILIMHVHDIYDGSDLTTTITFGVLVSLAVMMHTMIISLEYCVPRKNVADKVHERTQTELAPQNASWQCTVCGTIDFATATDLLQTFHSQERNTMILKDQENMYATLKQAFSSSSWYVYESGEKLAQSLLDAIDGSDERETRRLCEKAHQVFVELLVSPLVVEDKSWRVLKRQVLVYKRAKLCLYLFPDPRDALSDLQNVLDTMAVYYPKDHEFIRGLEETMAQALS